MKELIEKIAQNFYNIQISTRESSPCAMSIVPGGSLALADIWIEMNYDSGFYEPGVVVDTLIQVIKDCGFRSHNLRITPQIVGEEEEIGDIIQIAVY